MNQRNREAWNALGIFLRPDGTWEPQCPVCWFRDYAAAMVDGVCFSCWMLKNKPDEYHRYWEQHDANKGIDPLKGKRISDGAGTLKRFDKKLSSSGID